jgi:hypothetical protein
MVCCYFQEQEKSDATTAPVMIMARRSLIAPENQKRVLAEDSQPLAIQNKVQEASDVEERIIFITMSSTLLPVQVQLLPTLLSLTGSSVISRLKPDVRSWREEGTNSSLG